MLTLQPIGSKIPLIQLIESDDRALLSSPEAEGYKILYYFAWTDHRGTAAEYYNALYQFNIRELEKRVERFLGINNVTVEAKEEAMQRLLFSRATMQNTKAEEATVLYDGKVEPKNPTVKPETLAPGIVPIRLGGKKPKCFFAMFKSFLGASLMGFPSEPETVHSLLNSNPSFVRVCGFAPKEETDPFV